MRDDYLWDKSGEPDPEIQRLENLLKEFRQQGPAREFPAPEFQPRRSWLSSPLLKFVAAAAVVVLAVGVGYAVWWSRPAWHVARVEGEPKVGSRRIRDVGRLVVGQWLETDSASRAKISVGMIGEVEVEPNTRIGLVRARPTEHRLALDRGAMRATIWAPPRLFYVNTPSAVAVDLGCRYTLRVDEKGAGLLHVTYGWVAFEQRGRESFVPAGAMCVTRPGLGPGTPYFEDASEKFRTALAQFDSSELIAGVHGGIPGGVEGGVPGGVPSGVSGGVSGGVAGGVVGGVTGGVEGSARVRAAALGSVLAAARRRDALTLWHLLGRTNEAERPRVYDRLAELVSPPPGVTREGMLRGDPRMLDLWWDVLGLGDTSWWRMWKGPVPVR